MIYLNRFKTYLNILSCLRR